MLHTRTATIAAIALASALATATLATPAFAQKNNGDFKESIEANNKGGEFCTDLLNYYTKWTKKMNESKDKGQKAIARDAANGFLGDAWAHGCSWTDAVRTHAPLRDPIQSSGSRRAL